VPGLNTLDGVEPVERVDRVERVTNLLLVLLDAQVPLTLEHIVHTVAGYPPGHDAYRQAFERDKRLLREQGIPVTLEPVPDSDAVGYRIRPEDYYLPDLELTLAEQQALNLALAGVAMEDATGQEAAWKLGLAEPGRVNARLPLAALPSAPALPVLHDAIRRRCAVRFRHRGRQRTLEPYGLLFRRGFWYVVGSDRDRRALRSFRVDRIEDLPRILEEDHFERPRDFDISRAFPEDPWLVGDGQVTTATVWVDRIHAPLVEAELGSSTVTAREDDGSVVVELQVVNTAAFRSWVLGLLDHAEVRGPEWLRADIIDWLSPMAAVDA
jgi:proteasome accessory factor B